MNYYLGVLKKYAVFSGRATRSEYWYFTLFNVLITVAISFLDLFGVSEIVVFVVALLYALALYIPSLAVTVRRFHDTNHSGWWLLIILVPLVGFIVWIVFLVMDSDPTDNQYGQNPKGTVIGLEGHLC
ncbi:MAG: DUF805 domain-containing protein [Minisyncoccia bacterium]